MINSGMAMIDLNRGNELRERMRNAGPYEYLKLAEELEGFIFDLQLAGNLSRLERAAIIAVYGRGYDFYRAGYEIGCSQERVRALIESGVQKLGQLVTT